MTRWLKRELATLRSQIDTFALRHALYRSPESIEAELRGHVWEIVTANLTEFRTMIEDRAMSFDDTAAHFRGNPSIYGDSNPEMIDRFEGLARATRRDLAKIDAILEKLTSGLPDEVASYRP